MGRSPEDEPLTLTRCHSCGLPQLYEALEGWNSVGGQAYNFKGIKGNISFISFLFSFVSLLISLISQHDAVRPRGGGMRRCIINK